MFMMPLLYLFSKNPIKFDFVAGLDMGGPHFEQSTSEIFNQSWDPDERMFRCFDADVSAWDKIMPAALTRSTLCLMIQIVIGIHERFGTYNKRVSDFAGALLEWWDDMSLFYGGVILPFGVMPSGFVMTLDMNSAMNQLLAVCVILSFSKKYKLAFPLDYTDWIIHKALGDDSQTGIKQPFIKECDRMNAPQFSAIEYNQILGEWGILSTLGNKSEGILRYQQPKDLVFLQHTMKYIKIPCYNLTDLPPDDDKSDSVLVGASPLKPHTLIKMLAKQDDKSVVHKPELLLAQVEILLRELVPYGPVRHRAFREAVRVFFDKRWKPDTPIWNHRYGKILEWNYWLSEYVDKFCDEGCMDGDVIYERDKNPHQFEEVLRNLNPNGVETLSYE
jgi:hypothetical protein